MSKGKTPFADELIDEALGQSTKRWALILFAVCAAAAAVLWLTGRTRVLAPEAPRPVPGPPAAQDEPAPAVAGRGKSAATRFDAAFQRVPRPPEVVDLVRRPLARRRSGSADPST